jgi:hypothetical protein
VAATRDSSLRGASRPPGGPIPSHVRRLAHALCWIAPEPSVNDKDSGLRSFLNRNDFFADCNPHTDGLPQAREGISTCRSRTRGSREERDYRGKGAQTPPLPVTSFRTSLLELLEYVQYRSTPFSPPPNSFPELLETTLRTSKV